ncbi:MAG: hypothetical protein ACREFQ_19220 [Stellaceae bacterium]
MRRIQLFSALAIIAALAGCHGASPVLPSATPGHNAQTELRRERDCANPQWKAANLGLWYNVCRSDDLSAS